MKQRDTGSKEVEEVEEVKEVKESGEWRVASGEQEREKQVPRCACLAGKLGMAIP